MVAVRGGGQEGKMSRLVRFGDIALLLFFGCFSSSFFSRRYGVCCFYLLLPSIPVLHHFEFSVFYSSICIELEFLACTTSVLRVDGSPLRILGDVDW
jgi:hypothetical protein